ncbi:pilus assembly protein TadG-related protein [uncultured Roseovarius sp.]|uniref:pilus assembly protein TadG-related protein n=1 Tax=uncultured Roseovarius sp. TaxID=293344 RepID=UPI00261C369A|nr:pilus assembly protein TadG-related protein [uncultured Roseovarius sp.]
MRRGEGTPAPSRRHVDNFVKDEEGSITLLSFFIFFMLLLMGGIGLDTMRQEMSRASLQATLDRAVLAGATAIDEETARNVVEDYFAKSGQSEYLEDEQEGDIDIRLNSSRVTARASRSLDTYLMKLAGVDTLDSQGTSTAEVTIPKLEVAVVLDVSGSMMGDRIDALRPAAKEFVSSILDSTEPGDAVISVIPFSWGVTPSDSMFEALNVTQTHNYSTCIKFSDSDFTSVAVDPNSALPQQIYTSREGLTFGNLISTPLTSFDDRYYRSCYTDEYFRIMPYATDKSKLHAKIDSLKAGGSTSGDEGIKWAAALMDTAFVPVVSELQQEKQEVRDDGTIHTYTEVDPTLTNLPASYTESDTLKVIVMMGDGANDNSYFFSENSYRGSNSDLFKVTYQEQDFAYAYDIYDPSRQWHGSYYEQYCYLNWLECVYEPRGEQSSAYYLRRPSDSRMLNITDGGSVSWYEFNNFDDNMNGFVSSERLSWEEAWGLMSVRFYGNKTGNWGPWNNYIGNSVNKSTKDARMANICEATKSNGVVIYTIAFEMGSQQSAAERIRQCASSTAHHYNATNVNIGSAFSAIAANVKQLRLTQ